MRHEEVTGVGIFGGSFYIHVSMEGEVREGAGRGKQVEGAFELRGSVSMRIKRGMRNTIMLHQKPGH